MKKFISFFAVMPIAAMLLTACNNDPLGQDLIDIRNGNYRYWTDAVYRYTISLGFSDKTGNDLVAPLGGEGWQVNPDKYSLNIYYSFLPGQVPITRGVFKAGGYDCNYHSTSTEDGKYYLSNECATLIYQYDGLSRITGEIPVQDSITYKILCETIFGDHSYHEVVTYWGKDPDVVFDKEDTRSWHLFPQCKGARFEGKEIEVKQVVVDSTGYRDYNGYFIDIVLER